MADEWTEDMRIAIAPAREEALVEFVFPALLAFASADETCRQIRERFDLSEDDAWLALDRIPGGIVRALTCNPQNRPNREQDPLAYIAFEKVWSELPRLHWLSKRRKSGGRWLVWFEELRCRSNLG